MKNELTIDCVKLQRQIRDKITNANKGKSLWEMVQQIKLDNLQNPLCYHHKCS